jgi:hypothetical protein
MVETKRSREMRRVLARHERSGLTLSEFGRREGLVAPTLYWWRRRLRAVGKEAPAAVSFAEVSAVAATGGGDGFELVLDGGTTVRVPQRFNPVALRMLLETLREC